MWFLQAVGGSREASVLPGSAEVIRHGSKPARTGTLRECKGDHRL